VLRGARADVIVTGRQRGPLETLALQTGATVVDADLATGAGRSRLIQLLRPGYRSQKYRANWASSTVDPGAVVPTNVSLN
jgi:hypothetical protein